VYEQYIKGLCNSRLGTTNHAITHVAHVTTASYSLEPPPNLSPCVGLTFSGVANIRIVMILYDLCLLPAQFHYLVINIHHCTWRAACDSRTGVHAGKLRLDDSRYIACAQTTWKTSLPTVVLLLRSVPSDGCLVYRAVPTQRTMFK
jgi:hypothetical protein